MNINVTFSNVDTRLYRAHEGESASGNPYIDIFFLNENKNITYGKTSELIEDEIYPLKRRSFNDLECYIPNNPHDWFKRKYGGVNPLEKCLLWNHSINNYWNDEFDMFKYEFDFNILDEKWKIYFI